MRYLIILFCFIGFKISLFAQRDTSWTNLKVVRTEFYSLKVPSNWFDLGSTGTLVDQCFDATSAYFVDSFNSAPIIVGLFVLNAPAENLQDAVRSCLKGYKENPDRMFPEDFIEGQQKITLQSGQEAFLLNTRFFRPTKQLNQSRYDLVVYSDKAKQGYLVTVSVQYKDDSYQFEKANNLEAFAQRIYNEFRLN